MVFKGWDKVCIHLPEGDVEGIAPVILSASRSTDIPAFHAEWFMRRLQSGYAIWINPFNQKSQTISFEKMRVVVFWTKNPRPLFPYLTELDGRNIQYYFTFTVNDYESEGWEPGVPPLAERIETFKELSARIGKQRVIWRFDPILLTQDVTVQTMVEKIHRVGQHLHEHTEKLVFSFADIDRYAKVRRNLQKYHIPYKPISQNEMHEIAQAVGRMGKDWGISVATCAEEIDLNRYGIMKNKCIDDQLILRLWKNDPVLASFLATGASQSSLFDDFVQHCTDLKDSGQRIECGCIVSKDIGQYNTCLHLCRYCYANTSEDAVKKKFWTVDSNRNSIAE